jgi:hypothetical protein
MQKKKGGERKRIILRKIWENCGGRNGGPREIW